MASEQSNDANQSPETSLMKPEMSSYSEAAASPEIREITDIFLYSGSIEESSVAKFVDMVLAKKPKIVGANGDASKNDGNDGRPRKCYLFLTTYGGDPDGGYRLISSLRRSYDSVALIVVGPCKSAGTLIALGADEIYMAETGEFGPLDVQIRSRDQDGSANSGLEIMQSFNICSNFALSCFAEHFNTFSDAMDARTAAEIASKLTIGLLNPVFAQFEPQWLGAVQRAMEIAQAYNTRFEKMSDSQGRAVNLRPGAIKRLIHGYPTHSFVIDIDEAKELFERVGDLPGRVANIASKLSNRVTEPQFPVDIEDLTRDISGDI